MYKKILKKRQEYIQSKVNVELFWEKKEEINNIHYRMLKDFDDFCTSNNIEYWLEGGSLIGAYFHEAIIPWDDDLDLAMTRENWNKLESLNPTWEDMVLQTYGHDKNFNSVKFHKLRDKHSFLNDGRYWSSGSNEHQGLFVDIFVYDDTQYPSYESTPGTHKKMLRKSLLLRNFYELTHLFPFETSHRKNLESEHCTNSDFKYMRLDYRCSTKENKHYFLEKDKVFPLQRVKFGDGEFPAPKDISYYLQLQYGDIVKYPPKEKQKPSHIIEYKKFN
ncbi:LicD family protein [Streptococcus suis]|nr:LicD family protein [Streptococcus suis]MBY5039290.1 LicD family protein [Streptococcus suis]